MRKYTRRLVVASALALTMATAPVANAEDKILASVPGLTFPFFVHMMNAFKAEAEKQGMASSRAMARCLRPSRPPSRSRDHPRRQGHRHQPERSRRHGAGPAAGGRSRHPGRHRRPPRGPGRRHSRPCRRRQRQGRRSPGQSDRLRCSPMARRSSTCRASPAPRPRSTATRACTTCSTAWPTSTRSCSSRPPASTAPRALR